MTAKRNRLDLLAEIWRKHSKGSWRDAERALRRAILEGAFFETTLRTLGRSAMFEHRSSFYPVMFLPDYRGPYFDEALRRLVLPRRGPMVAWLSITGVCPSRCEYCYASAGGKEASDLGDAPILAAARGLVDRGVPLINLSGGEPLSRYRRVKAVLAEIARRSEVRLLTSGFGLDQERAAELKSLGLALVAVSLDCDDPETFDRRRGHPQAFSAATSALRAATSAELLTVVNCVVDGKNLRTAEEVRRFLDLVRSIDAEIFVNFVPKFALGRAKGQGFASVEQYLPLSAIIAEVIERDGARASIYRQPLEVFMGCVGAGGKNISVDTRGNIAVCISDTALGNIAQEPFDALYRRYVEATGTLSQGFFCAHAATQHEQTLDGSSTEAALRSFEKAHSPARYQRLLNRFEPALAWLAR